MATEYSWSEAELEDAIRITYEPPMVNSFELPTGEDGPTVVSWEPPEDPIHEPPSLVFCECGNHEWMNTNLTIDEYPDAEIRICPECRRGLLIITGTNTAKMARLKERLPR